VRAVVQELFGRGHEVRLDRHAEFDVHEGMFVAIFFRLSMRGDIPHCTVCPLSCGCVPGNSQLCLGSLF
jgi:hypothetical protein